MSVNNLEQDLEDQSVANQNLDVYIDAFNQSKMIQQQRNMITNTSAKKVQDPKIDRFEIISRLT